LIKIIVADLDGTLLDSKKQLPENFPALIRELTKKGILSSRQRPRVFIR
jgi:hydroxymethylpyrimidine pyrophosphatase-like HAD family hydrolase